MTKFEPDEALIRRLAALLEETGLSEIEYEADGRRIRVGRGAGTAFGAATAPSPAQPIIFMKMLMPAMVGSKRGESGRRIGRTGMPTGRSGRACGVLCAWKVFARVTVHGPPDSSEGIG